jgi:hypothetical protein
MPAMKAPRIPLYAAAAAFLFSASTASAVAPAEFLKKVPISLSSSAQTALGGETLSGVDFAGKARLVGHHVDIGCYEASVDVMLLILW